MSVKLYKEAARPTAVYAAIVATLIIVVAMVCGRPIPAGVAMEVLGPVWAYAGYYARQRTQEKLQTNQQGN